MTPIGLVVSVPYLLQNAAASVLAWSLLASMGTPSRELIMCRPTRAVHQTRSYGSIVARCSPVALADGVLHCG